MDFPHKVSLSIDEKNYSNKKESLEFSKSIILPYIQNVRQIMSSESQKTLLIYDFFREKTTDMFLGPLKENNVIATKEPPNMAHLFQQLDLTVNTFAKDFIKRKFSE